MTDVAELGPGEIGYHHRADQAGRRHPRRRHDHRRQAPDRRGAARLQAGAAGGVLRPVPGRRRRFRGSARRDGPAAPQRRELLLRDGDLGGARLRLPLRLPRPAASRDHPGAAGARVQPRPHRHRALGHLQDRADATAPTIELHNPADMPDVVQDRGDPGALDQGDDPDARRLSRRDPETLPGPARRRRSTSTMSASARWWSTNCRSTKSCSTSTTG